MIKLRNTFSIIFLAIIFLAIIAISSFTFVSPVSYSQDQPVCPDFTVQLIQESKLNFYDDLKIIISDASPATENTTLAFDLYRDYLSNVSSLFQDNSPNIPESQSVLSGPVAEKCKEIILTDKSIVQETLQNILKASISGKQSFNLTEKYSQINQQFIDLNLQSNQVSKKIKDFSQQLPCYAQACVQD